MKERQRLSLLGLAQRAGKIASGEDLVIKAIQKRRARLVIIAEDTSETTRKKIMDKCSYYQVPVKMTGDRHSLGNAIGKPARVAIAVLDEGFAKKLLTLFDAN